MFCFLGFHKYKVIKLYKYNDVSFGLKEKMTKRFYKCTNCKRTYQDKYLTQNEPLPGHDWELSDFE